MSNSIALNSSQIKNAEVEILLRIKDLCQRHNLCYSLAGGTLLGAIRHHGFIPWDDDIDIMMPRPDFNTFIDICESEFKSDAELGLYRVPKQYSEPLYVKVINPTIIVKERYVKEREHLWVDVIPVDGLPSDLKKTKAVYKKVSVLRNIFSLSQANPLEGKTPVKRILKRIIVPIVKRLNISSLIVGHINTLVREHNFDNSNYVGVITWGLYGSGERMPRSGFQQMKTVEFEHNQFSAVSCWDTYLSGIYGDYMQLPPKNQRNNHGLQATKVFS